jgi:hypothetical protein
MASGLCAALTGRTHGCTDQPANVKKTLANSEPSTHGTKRTCRDGLPIVCFRSKADMPRGPAASRPDENDPKATSAALIKAWQVVKSFCYLLTDPYELNILLHRPTGGERVQFNQKCGLRTERGP